MKARIHVTVSCEADGCERETEATAELVTTTNVPLRGQAFATHRFDNLRFPPSPTGEASGWRCDERGAWCGEHGEAQKERTRST